MVFDGAQFCGLMQVHGCSGGGSGSSTSGGKSPPATGYDSDGDDSNSSSAGSISVAGGATSPGVDFKSEYKGNRTKLLTHSQNKI